MGGHQPQGCQVIDLTHPVSVSNIQMVHGLGYDGVAVQFGPPTKEPLDGVAESVSYVFEGQEGDAVDVVLYTVPFWPLYKGKTNRVGVSIDDSPVQVFENKFKEYDRTWKDQVMRNGAVCRLHFAIDKTKHRHTLNLKGDPGQMVQRVIIDWGGLQPSYIGPEK